MILTQRITHSTVQRFLMALLFVGASAILPFASAHSSLAASSHAKGTIKIGVKDFAEEQIIASMYQLLLQKAGFAVSLHNLGETAALHAALRRGDIDLYPEYTGTGLFVLKYPGNVVNPTKAYKIVKTQYEKRFHITWLQQSPMNDTNDVAVTPATSGKFGLHTLTDLARVAPGFSFADDPACKGRPDCLAGMQAHYGIHFKSVTDISSTPARYSGLLKGQFNAVEVFTTDAPIRANHLVVLVDNKRAVFPADHIAPIVRDPTLNKFPQIRTILNPLARYITTEAMIRLNGLVILQGKDATAVARAFLKSKHLL